MSASVIVIGPEELAELIRKAVDAALAELQEISPALLDRNGLAQRLGVSVGMIDRFRRDGCPVVWVGSAPRFELDAMLAFLRARGHEGDDAAVG